MIEKVIREIQWPIIWILSRKAGISSLQDLVPNMHFLALRIDATFLARLGKENSAPPSAHPVTKNSTDDISCVDPELYGKRFVKFLSNVVD